MRARAHTLTTTPTTVGGTRINHNNNSIVLYQKVDYSNMKNESNKIRLKKKKNYISVNLYGKKQ